MDNPTFVYDRITTELDSTLKVDLDETRIDILKGLSEKAKYEFNEHSQKIIKKYCTTPNSP